MRAPPDPPAPSQRSGSWALGYTVPATVSSGPSFVAWQAMQPRPGFISADPWLPCVHITPLEQVGAAANGSGAPSPPSPPSATTIPPSGLPAESPPSLAHAAIATVNTQDKRTTHFIVLPQHPS